MVTPTALPVPSTDPNDLLFNTEKLDEAINSGEPTYTDRLGVSRKTLAGAIATIEALNSRGPWAPDTAYALKDLVLESGTWYVCVAPHTSSASFATDEASKWRVHQGVTDADLAADDGASLMTFLPSGTGARSHALQAWLRYGNFNAFAFLSDEEIEDVVAGTTLVNCSTNLQKAFDAAKTAGADLRIPAGTYLCIGLKMYGFQRVIFESGAIFKQAADGFCIRTVVSIGDSIPTGNIIRAQLINSRVDMNSKNGFGILWECVTSGLIDTPRVTNIGTGTYSYDDGNGAQSYPTAGLALKGISGLQGCYWNIVDGPRMNGAGNRGIWIGTSFARVEVGGTYSKANNNIIRNPLCTTQTVGIDIHLGDDNVIMQPDVTSCTTGILVGAGGGGVYFCNRNRLFHVYAESCTTGVNVTDESSSTSLSLSSVVGTATPYTDNGYATEIIYPKRLGSGDWARFYDKEVRGVAGVKFLATREASADANTLDDYEEGTFTPTVVGTTTVGSATYANQVGKYRFIGDTVHFWVRANYSLGTGTGNLRLGGLPVNADINFNSPVNVRASGLTFTGQLMASIVSNDNVIDFFVMASGAALAAVAYDAAADIYVSGSYIRV